MSVKILVDFPFNIFWVRMYWNLPFQQHVDSTAFTSFETLIELSRLLAAINPFREKRLFFLTFRWAIFTIQKISKHHALTRRNWRKQLANNWFLITRQSVFRYKVQSVEDLGQKCKKWQKLRPQDAS